ncbi:YitT family protein [Neobacillus sp. PS3-34]|uniref:YitT family protein n=1 Tax=Neobacillus sp. PS3-34 TaxID=3070678 RepID=UPI0027E03EC5|nr:YitT family protein [Neobacillus sp. PS3-34]WML48221.1 YitT family protein [Neobacillus sp. PS3-34]
MVIKLFTIIIASVLIGIGINAFVIPSHVINGGIWGISLLIHYLWGWKLAVTFTCLNLPIYFAAMYYDLHYFFYGLIGTFISAIIISLLNPLNGLFHLPFLLNICLGGIFIGTGVGIMLRIHASPGGIDLLALMVSKSLSLNVGLVILIIDTVIILSGVLIFKEITFLYSLIIISLVGTIASLLTSIKSISVFT